MGGAIILAAQVGELCPARRTAVLFPPPSTFEVLHFALAFLFWPSVLVTALLRLFETGPSQKYTEGNTCFADHGSGQSSVVGVEISAR